MKRKDKIKGIISLTVLVLVAWIMFSGKISYRLEKDTFQVGSFLSGNSKVGIQDIKELELREGIKTGERLLGISSFRMLGGSFANEEFGKYKLYKYKDLDKVIVIYTADGVIVFNLETEEKTQNIFKELQEIIK
ncbi:PH domain-containing protein [Alloiococcus sp. CFN-8]|uniref:PH domain-containing protein n=1 Tax=Alloiococcus sp. CFN-8 TaxID=3416081 RepID=UPI003CF60F04